MSVGSKAHKEDKQTQLGRCGAIGVAGNCSWIGSWSGSSSNTVWHILVSTQGVSVVGVVDIFCMPV